VERGVRLIVFDASGRDRRGAWPGLGPVWGVGAQLYQSLSRADHRLGATSWTEALRWIARIGADRPIDEVQLWMHGRWGRALLGPDVLDAAAFAANGRWANDLTAIRERMHGRSLVWFRTCETFGAQAGLSFAARVADYFGCQAAGHTYVIGAWQSGLHSALPGRTPAWSPEEGIARGSASSPERAHHSAPWRPHTIHFLVGRVPEGW
jgi:hypothetical protein